MTQFAKKALAKIKLSGKGEKPTAGKIVEKTGGAKVGRKGKA